MPSALGGSPRRLLQCRDVVHQEPARTVSDDVVDDSADALQHYFTDRADLVRAAFHRVQEQTKERIEGELAAGPDASAPAVISAILRSLIPLTPSQLADHRVAQDFEMYALRDPSLLQELRVGHSGLVDFLTQQLAGAHDAVATTPRADPARTVLTLIATAEGLADLVQIGHLPSPVAMDLLNGALANAL